MKKILLGICGSIAAYKTPELVRQLVADGFEVQVIMTEPATKFVSPLVLQSLSGKQVFTQLFDEQEPMKHLELSRKADLFLIAPLSANTLAKIAQGFGDDLLSATVLGAKIPILVAPAMNTAMWNNFFVQDNLKRLETSGIQVIAPEEGELACGEYGMGRLVSLSELVFCARRSLTSPVLAGRKVLVSMGPTREHFDEVRFLSNHSSGLMGYELAIAAYLRGAEVTVFSSTPGFNWPKGIRLVPFDSAQALFDLMRLVERKFERN
jgi:phosphopantothenoylcysteine decarboxylase/phosphopantothenate--cysteine ligase